MSDSKISFLLNKKQVDIDFVEDKISPTTTVLNYLRSLHDHKGTKEGCAEGDCGACTVAIVEVDDQGALSYKACDSCLMFLPMVHGKQLITVEGLKKGNTLHPTQEAMIDSDGSQCGYCTPGIMMSLFTMYQNSQSGQEVEVKDCLTGNLCRCTGYRPIVEAGKAMVKEVVADHFVSPAEEVRAELSTVVNTLSVPSIKCEEQEYHQPKTLDHALELKLKLPQALLVNGATDVGLMVTKQRKLLPLIIDLSAIKELKIIKDHGDRIEYGAGASLEAVKRSCGDIFPALYNMLVVFGSKQIRELATLGGNVANASPIGDMPPILMAYNASVKLVSKSGSRVMKLVDFITGYRTTDLRPDEMIYAIEVQKDLAGSQVKSYKISKRKDLDISTVSAGFRLKLDLENKVEELKLYYGGMAAMVKRADQTEAFLLGKDWNRENIESAQGLVKEDFTPISDARSGAKGRAVMAKNLLLKFWLDTYES